MFPDFIFDPSDSSAETGKAQPMSSEDNAQLEELFNRRMEPEERNRLERLLLQRLKEKKLDLQRTLAEMSDHWNYEDPFYHYYHGSFKVYRVQQTTERAVKLLRELLPERELSPMFERIIRDGTGKVFETGHNKDWNHHTRPLLEAFAHAKFMIEMAVRYADLSKPPQPMPSGYAALLYLYDLR